MMLSAVACQNRMKMEIFLVAIQSVSTQRANTLPSNFFMVY